MKEFLHNILRLIVLLAILGGFLYFMQTPNDNNTKDDSWTQILCPNEEEFACGKNLSCEGVQISISGFVDMGNIDESYPKFILTDKKDCYLGYSNGRVMEIWLTKNDPEFFQRLKSHVRSEKMIEIMGEIKGFDAPIMGDCRREMYIIANPNDIKFVF